LVSVTFDYEDEERERLAAEAVLRGGAYAGFWIRVCATLIDVALLWLAEVGLVFIVWTAGLLPLTEKELGEGLALFLAVIFWAFPAWPYFAFMEASTAQATLGKRLFRLIVTDATGRRISLARAGARHWAKVLSYVLFFLGFVVIAFSDRKRGLHDMVAGTLVLWRPDRPDREVRQ
jgi:uncharacterized RDD family membrane protein YckC